MARAVTAVVEDFEGERIGLIKQVSRRLSCCRQETGGGSQHLQPGGNCFWKGLQMQWFVPPAGTRGGQLYHGYPDREVNPSGKLPMTFAVKYGDAPSDANFPLITSSRCRRLLWVPV